MSAWLLLHVYVLVDDVDCVIVWFQSSDIEKILVYSGWEGGLLCIFAELIYELRETCFGRMLWEKKRSKGNQYPFNRDVRR